MSVSNKSGLSGTFSQGLECRGVESWSSSGLSKEAAGVQNVSLRSPPKACVLLVAAEPLPCPLGALVHSFLPCSAEEPYCPFVSCTGVQSDFSQSENISKKKETGLLLPKI